ncbi:subclass B3 metallo-beta-lactamase [Croceibacterium sp. LX-88]|uniref:Subclass B3 metallo-beta-lactamase n=1 Tax=Croceibacterium selenioxidans TaxID=2838833 RepID=A0ABS5W185_9SPHN|nr:subclass B3 metallo-beta-lactamase [Croceibacterium selenioxidans]MBT2133532.1 subclass B3 metallo-beta-lactamase [Croceibacterium selenioxidans]
MSVRFLAIAALLAASCTPAAADTPLPEGVTAEQFLAQCQDKDGWSDPAPPIRLFGNVYDVGTCGIVSLLVVGNAGHVLLDGATSEAAPLIAANIQRLGFKLGDVKWIVTSHEHFDHVGGVSELQRLTGAKLAARAEQRHALETGVVDQADPQAGMHDPFAKVRVDKIMTDGETLSLGDLSLTLHATPGHAPGSTTWSWRSCEAANCHSVVFADSISAVSSDSYRFSDHPDYVAAFRASLDKIAALDCDILITPHPAASTLYERLAGDAPLVLPGACSNYADFGRERIEARLQSEQNR